MHHRAHPCACPRHCPASLGASSLNASGTSWTRSQLKRSIDGTYHHVSHRHLDRYLAEFDYRYNTRGTKDGERTAQAIKQTTGKRLTYRKPVVE